MKRNHSRYPNGRQFGCFVIGLFVIFLLPASVCDIFAADTTRIRLPAKAQVDDEKILLGKIAEIRGGDPLLIEKLRGIVLGRSPLPGHSRKFDSGNIKARLRQNRLDLADLNLSIPPVVVVSRSFIEVSRQEIERLVSDYVSRELLAGRANASIKRIQVSESLRLPPGRIDYEVSIPRNHQQVGQVPLAIRFDVNGKRYKRIWATVTIEALAEVVITKKPLGRHKRITEDDIEVARMDLAKVPSNVITDPEVVLGKRTRRAIGSKTVLRANLVEFPPLVKRGDVVVIVAETSSLKITALGQVKRKGAIGDRIPVMNFESKKVLYARVVDANTVKVDF